MKYLCNVYEIRTKKVFQKILRPEAYMELISMILSSEFKLCGPLSLSDIVGHRKMRFPYLNSFYFFIIESFKYICHGMLE